MIKNSLLIITVFIFSAGALFSQAHPVLFSAEIQAIEKKLANPKLSQAERKEALSGMARLFELSGNPEGAARAWAEAAAVTPGEGGHEALLRSARCLAAAGEFEKAETALAPVLGNRRLAPEARVLNARIGAFKTGRTETLSALAADPAYAAWKPVLYYSIWKIAGDGAARNRLMEEFPQSPEARIAAGDSRPGEAGDPRISAAPTALWLLMGAEPVVSPQAVPEQRALPVQLSQTPPSQTLQEALPQTDSQTAASRSGPVMLQTGLFGREENARAMAEKLRAAGFTPLVAKKTVNGKDHWAAGVEPGSDPSRTGLLLKDRGFESFPVY